MQQIEFSLFYFKNNLKPVINLPVQFIQKDTIITRGDGKSKIGKKALLIIFWQPLL